MNAKKRKLKSARVTEETASIVEQIINANPARRYSRIQVYGLAVEMAAKKFLPLSTINCNKKTKK